MDVIKLLMNINRYSYIRIGVDYDQSLVNDDNLVVLQIQMVFDLRVIRFVISLIRIVDSV